MSENYFDGWCYLHENKKLIFKHANYPVEDMRDSDLVKAIWVLNTKDRKNAWQILIEALCVGADKEEIKRLAEKWGCDDKDAEVYADRIGVSLSIDGDTFCAKRKDFTNLQESPSGFGETALDAMSDLCRQLGFRPNKLNRHHDFHQLVTI